MHARVFRHRFPSLDVYIYCWIEANTYAINVYIIQRRHILSLYLCTTKSKSAHPKSKQRTNWKMKWANPRIIFLFLIFFNLLFWVLHFDTSFLKEKIFFFTIQPWFVDCVCVVFVCVWCSVHFLKLAAMWVTQ